MDTGIEKPVRTLEPHLKGTDTRDQLAHAAKQAAERNYGDYYIVDVDAHHYENQSWGEIIDRVPSDVIQQIGRSFQQGDRIFPGLINVLGFPQNQSIGGRIDHNGGLMEPVTEADVHRDVTLIRRAMGTLGVDYQITFPTPMLALGQHPEADVEAAVAEGYNEWLTEKILSADDRIRSMLYLPFNDPETCERIVERFAGRRGVAGFMVTSVRNRPVHHNSYMRLYRMLEERGLPLAFHAGPFWGASDGFVRQLNRFLSVHAISFSLCNMVHLANWVMNGLPEKFPKLKVIWIESGVAWMAFMTQRFDNEYLMRSSEAPALKRLPSEYMKEMYYTSQPMERTDMKLLEATMNAIDAKNSMMYASDWPHWDFDLPSTILDLPFLDEQSKRNILGLNAKKLFGL